MSSSLRSRRRLAFNACKQAARMGSHSKWGFGNSPPFSYVYIRDNPARSYFYWVNMGEAKAVRLAMIMFQNEAGNKRRAGDKNGAKVMMGHALTMRKVWSKK